MDIFERTRRLETEIARRMAGAARNLLQANPGGREPIELTHAILDTVEREIQPGGRGTRVFPFNTVRVSILAPSPHARAKIEAIVDGDLPLRHRIGERLSKAGCATTPLDVSIEYVPRAQKHWTDPQFWIAFSRVVHTSAPGVPPPQSRQPRLEIAIVHGSAEHRTYALTSGRIDLGRGGDVRDRRNGLIRTNQIVFYDNSDQANRSVSRCHAHILWDEQRAEFRLFDDGSVHGTSVVRRGRTLRALPGARGVRLQTGDDVALGEARLRVKFGDQR